jgi:predicted ester cyclase
MTLGLALALCATALSLFGAGVPGASAAQSHAADAAVEQKELVISVIDAVWNGQDVSALDTLVARDFQYQEADGTARALGARGLAFLIDYQRSSFPDLKYAVDEILAEGDTVAVRWSASGTHLGTYGLQAPTGADVLWRGITLFKVSDGKIRAAWVSQDWRAFDGQLGIDRGKAWGPASQ